MVLLVHPPVASHSRDPLLFAANRMAQYAQGVRGKKPCINARAAREGGLPYADRDGNLYGTMVEGGSLPTSDHGWKEIVLPRFLDHPGAVPYAGVILDAAGNLYRTTHGDDTTTFDSVFEITP
jgi:hypothetical protein